MLPLTEPLHDAHDVLALVAVKVYTAFALVAVLGELIVATPLASVVPEPVPV